MSAGRGGAARPGNGRPTAARSRATRAARTPFVLLVVALLGGGMVALLLLNSAINQGAFELSKLRSETKTATDQEQALQQQADQDAAPGTLQRRAERLGMVPGGNPVFLRPGGAVRGVPVPASPVGNSAQP